MRDLSTRILRDLNKEGRTKTVDEIRIRELERKRKMEQPINERIDKELLRETADYIEKHPVAFDQNIFGDYGRYSYVKSAEIKCETPCCIAGIIGIIRGYYLNAHQSVATFAKNELKLTRREAEILFGVRWDSSLVRIIGNLNLNMTHAKPEHAVKVLRALADDPGLLREAVQIVKEAEQNYYTNPF